jgi:hypothetical protein
VRAPSFGARRQSLARLGISRVLGPAASKEARTSLGLIFRANVTREARAAAEARVRDLVVEFLAARPPWPFQPAQDSERLVRSDVRDALRAAGELRQEVVVDLLTIMIFRRWSQLGLSDQLPVISLTSQIDRAGHRADRSHRWCPPRGGVK